MKFNLGSFTLQINLLRQQELLILVSCMQAEGEGTVVTQQPALTVRPSEVPVHWKQSTAALLHRMLLLW